MYIHTSSILFLPPNPPLKQFEAQRLSVYAEVLIVGTVPYGQSWRGLLSPMRKSSPRRHLMRLPSFQGWWSWERLIGVSLPCLGKTAFSHPMSAAQGMAWCLDPWCVSRHGVREARRPIRCLDDSSEGVLYAVPWVMEFRLKGVFDSRLWLTASLRGLIIHMLS